ncbi:hypothetical protein MN116_007757, partial [Schistosoma mekongi]
SSIVQFIITLKYTLIVCTCIHKELVNSFNVTVIHTNSSNKDIQHLNMNYLKPNTEAYKTIATYENLSNNSIVNEDHKDLNSSNSYVILKNTTSQYDNITTLSPMDTYSKPIEVTMNTDKDKQTTIQINQIMIENTSETINKLHHYKLNNEYIFNTNSSIKFIQYNTGDTIHLKCRIPKGSYLVLWNKLGLDYPLTIGKNRFIPDERFQIQHKPPNRWNLIISNAQLNDTGVYSCTPGAGITTSHTDISKESDLKQYHEYHSQPKESSRHTHMKVNDDTTRKKNNYREYYVSVVEPLPSERYQVDAPANKIRTRNKTITLTGPNLVFYGTPLELICRASFPSYEAKLDPTISLEWYHRGIRRLSNPLKSGGVYITMHWLDSHLLESRLFKAWASEADAGQWICLERSNPVKNVNYTSLSSSYRNRQMNGYNTQTSSSSSSMSYHYNTSVTYNPSKVDFVYDKIFIEIIVPTISSSSYSTNALFLSSLSSSSSTTTSLLSTTKSSPPSSSSSMFNRKHSKSNIFGVSQHLNSKHKKLSFIERLFSSSNSCRKLQLNQQTILILNCLFLYIIILYINISY